MNIVGKDANRMISLGAKILLQFLFNSDCFQMDPML